MASAADRIVAAQAKRDAIKLTEDTARQEQFAIDIEAIVELEAEHGYDRIVRIDIGSWKPDMGAPTCVAVRIPLNSEKKFKRFLDQINRAKEHSKEKLEAQGLLARSCFVYPALDSAEFTAALEVGPGLLEHAAYEIIQRSQGKAAEEGKG